MARFRIRLFPTGSVPQPLWTQLSQAVMEVLDSVTLKDLCDHADRLSSGDARTTTKVHVLPGTDERCLASQSSQEGGVCWILAKCT